MDGIGSAGFKAVFVEMVGVGSRESLVVVPFMVRGTEDTTCAFSGGGAREVGESGNDSDCGGKTSTGGMRLVSSIERRTVFTRNTGRIDPEGAVLALSLGGLVLIWMRDAKVTLDWPAGAGHAEAPVIEGL